jgi:hypothetical protein
MSRPEMIDASVTQTICGIIRNPDLVGLSE